MCRDEGSVTELSHEVLMFLVLGLDLMLYNQHAALSSLPSYPLRASHPWQGDSRARELQHTQG